MNNILNGIFKNIKPNFEKLEKFGFTLKNSKYCYSTEILNGQFLLQITIADGDIDTRLIDLATGEPYTLFLVENASGSFIGAVKSAYEEVMSEIAEKCFDTNIFKNACTQAVIKYVSETYGDELEFLWKKSPNNAIWRRKDNKKWYGVLLTLSSNKLGLSSYEQTEILDLRVDTENIDSIVNGKTIFYGYHMNKRHWLSVLLDGSVPLETVKSMLDTSYDLAREK